MTFTKEEQVVCAMGSVMSFTEKVKILKDYAEEYARKKCICCNPLVVKANKDDKEIKLLELELEISKLNTELAKLKMDWGS